VAGLQVAGVKMKRPYQTLLPYAGHHWQPEQPPKQPHEYIRNGTAKISTLFHPATGEGPG
jgi:hypothetical protein